MRVVVTGASGNTGTSLLQALADEPAVDSIVGLARRAPTTSFTKTEWVRADVSTSDLLPIFTGADAVVHLAWLIQPSRNLTAVGLTNVNGSERVFRAVGEAGVPNLVYASSIGAYSAAPQDRSVDESWPTDGIRTSFYSRHKSQVERLLDSFEKEFPQVRVVRLRPGLIFKRQAASSIRRLFLGPFVPTRLVRPDLIPIFPELRGVRFQCVHSLDVGHAYRLAIVGDVRGPFNIAADPVLDFAEVAKLLDARPVPFPKALVRIGADVTWRLRLQPSPPGWVDLAVGSPVMDTTRARTELQWKPRYTSKEALGELITGLHNREGIDTPPLSPQAGGPLRIREVLTGVGSR
ncbi:MAG TPA: NAD-dependent epimerase/dehydratase family protein [Actinomycetota bacterium]|nr:NAD-dependent epimerase/dehydratase family protein [Actinomycetota bacterium]